MGNAPVPLAYDAKCDNPFCKKYQIVISHHQVLPY